MSDDKLSELAKEIRQCKSDCLAHAAEIDALKAQLIAIREMLEDSLATLEKPT
jgi:hypothetical protein